MFAEYRVDLGAIIQWRGAEATPDTPAVAGLSSATALSAPAGVQTHVGAVAGAASAAALSTVAGVQAHVGVVAGATSATVLSDVAAGLPEAPGTLAPRSVWQLRTGDGGAWVQSYGHELARNVASGVVAGLSSAAALSTPTGVQTHVGAAAGAASATALSTVEGAQSGVAGATSATALSSPVGVQTHIGQIEAATSTTTLSNATEPVEPRIFTGGGPDDSAVDDARELAAYEAEADEVLQAIIEMIVAGALS